MRPRRVLGTCLIIALAMPALAACRDPGVFPDGLMQLSVNNGTTIPVGLVVNEVPVVTVAAGQQNELPASALPPLPWFASVNTVGGRTLVTLVVRSGDVRTTNSAQSGVGSRVDLSCGRIDLWSGRPLIGPMPGPGRPGDCD